MVLNLIVLGMPKYGGLAKLSFEEPDNTESEELIKVEYHKFEENIFCTGGAFVPKGRGVEEDDGWIITFLHNEDTNISQVSHPLLMKTLLIIIMEMGI